MADAPVWDVERMRPLVSEWDEALRAELPAYARLLPEPERRGSVLRPPATVAAVVAAVERLGVKLPPSYRSSLLLADGADAGADGAAYRVRGLEASEDRLLSIGDVVAYAADDRLSWLVNLWHEDASPFADRQEQPGDQPVEVFNFEPGLRAILVTAPVQDGIVGLVPGEPEWQVWEFFHTEVRAHRSFADFLGFHAHAARARVAKRAEQARSVSLDRVSWLDVQILAKHGDPKTMDAATRGLLDKGHFVQKEEIARTLGFLGDPTAIPPLREALARVDDPASRAPSQGG